MRSIHITTLLSTDIDWEVGAGYEPGGATVSGNTSSRNQASYSDLESDEFAKAGIIAWATASLWWDLGMDEWDAADYARADITDPDIAAGWNRAGISELSAAIYAAEGIYDAATARARISQFAERTARAGG